MKKVIIMTNIYGKTKAIKEFEKKNDAHIIIIGDKKSKKINNSSNLTFLSIEDQLKFNYSVMPHIPFNHYARKNIGYIYALQHGAEEIYETDDDNIPNQNWAYPEFSCNTEIRCESSFLNVFKYFTNNNIWPRGFPLDEILKQDTFKFELSQKNCKIGIWQGLVDNEPDVDAIYRLTNNESVEFAKNKQISIESGKYTPFNSQNTFWNKNCMLVAYLPATVTFRFTDILRGYIAQKILWLHGYSLGITSPSVYQERNEHDFMRDFESEVTCYLQVKKIVEILESETKKNSMSENIFSIYKKLSDLDIVKSNELIILENWLSDMEKFF